VTEAGPGGGCRLMDGYRFPLRGLRPDEAEALLILGVPAVLRELWAGGRADRRAPADPGHTGHTAPRWCISTRRGGRRARRMCPAADLARALRLGRKLAIRYPPPDREPRVVGPLGLVNKQGPGTWLAEAGYPGVPGGRVSAARVLPEPAERPAGFELAAFWLAGRRVRASSRDSRSGWPPRRTRWRVLRGLRPAPPALEPATTGQDGWLV